MWNCKRCSESVESNFEVCWNCGASIDGESDPNFESEQEKAKQPEAATPSSLVTELSKHFKCCKCQFPEGSIKWVNLPEMWAFKLFEFMEDQYVVVTCDSCGYTEFYNAENLRARKTIADLWLRN